MSAMTPVPQHRLNGVSHESAPASLVDELIALAHAAGTAAMRYYGGGVNVESKNDGTPVTMADKAAHALIVQGLAAIDPSIPVISEEGDVPLLTERRAWRRFWLVDPLDGTKEFIRQNGEFTVNIALIDAGEPVAGVVFAPAMNVTYYATKGGGAWKSALGAPAERIYRRIRTTDQPLVIVESRSHPSNALEDFLATINVGDRVQIGSSLKFCLVAEGTADVYPRLGPTMEWDVAAGDCIYRNASLNGQNASPLVYNSPDLRIAGFVVGL